MIVSTENGSLRSRLGERKTIELLSASGFKAIDYSFSPCLEHRSMPWSANQYREYALEVRRMAEDNGVYFNQAHGPFLFNTSFFPDYSKEILPLYARCFEICAILYIPHVVVHPLHYLPYLGNETIVHDINIDFYGQLLPLANEFGVKIALENMFQYDSKYGVMTRDFLSTSWEYSRFYDELNDSSFICLVDTGHCGIIGENPAEMIRTLGSRLKGLHINDNLGCSDDHIVPGAGLVDWDEVLRALAEIDYNGDITFEVLKMYRTFDDSFLPVAARYLCDIGEYMIKKIKEFKNVKGEHHETSSSGNDG